MQNQAASPRPILQQLRVAQTPKTTLSDLMVWSEPLNAYRHICYLIEDAIRTEKIKKETCLFEGVHRLGVRKWGRHYESYIKHKNSRVAAATKPNGLIEVFTPQFQGTLYHIGVDKDDTEGCPLPTMMYTLNGNGEFRGLNSEAGYIQLMTVPYLGGMTIPAYIDKFGGFVEIRNAKNLIAY